MDGDESRKTQAQSDAVLDDLWRERWRWRRVLHPVPAPKCTVENDGKENDRAEAND